MIPHDKLAVLTCVAYNREPDIREGSRVVFNYLRGVCVVIFLGRDSFSLKRTISTALSWPKLDEHLGVIQGRAGNRVSRAWPRVLKNLIGYDRVVFVGHGTGGSEAALAAAYTNKAGGKEVELVTFGSPRIGGKKLRDSLRGVKCTRYENSRDVMPKIGLPLSEGVGERVLLSSRSVNAVADHDICMYEKTVAEHCGGKSVCVRDDPI